MALNLEQNQAEHERWMQEALLLAKQAAEADEVPVGAIVVADKQIIGKGFNEPIRTCDPTAHAEIVAIRNASQTRKNYRLSKATLYVTIEPCTMCLGAMIHARIDNVVFGAQEPRAGALVSHPSLLGAEHYNHQLSFWGGVLESDCAALMQSFFKVRRNRK